VVVAVVQVAEGHYLDAPELAAWCRAHLPSTLTPEQFVFVETIERSPSGDADYQRLRDLALDQLLKDR
jgi:acyl-CoA synthetase (AMP-forming)/AMP-acid ligase II